MNPRHTERRHALRATVSNPVLWLRHGAACVGFLAAYAATRLGRKVTRDIHAVGKSDPPGLPRTKAALSSRAPEGPIRLPDYTLDDRADWPSASPAAAAPAGGDLEAYFAANRWVDCLQAIGGTDAEVVAAVGHALAWWRRAPARSDPAWEPYSAAERVANLVVLLAARPRAQAQIDAADLRAFLHESQQWITAHLEYYGPRRTNNHILNDARALVIAGAALDLTSVVDQGLRLFARMGRDLFQPGGFLRERSAHYHVIVTNWILDAVHFGRLAARSPAIDRASLAELEALAGRALEAAAILGSWATGDSLIGDISPDCSPKLAFARIRRLYGTSMSPHDGDGVSRHVDDWVFLRAADQRVAACTIDGAFPLDRPTHGHSDLTHINWRWRDESILVDPGRARYTKDAISLAQAGAEGHNVLMMNGLGPLAESLVDGGLWHLRPYANATVTTRVDDDSLTVTHDGFRRAGPATTATRTVRLTAAGLMVTDRVEGKGTATLDRLWHFSPHVRAVGAAAVAGRSFVASATNDSPAGARSETSWGTYVHSSVYGDATPAPLLRIRTVATLPCTLTMTWSVSPCAA